MFAEKNMPHHVVILGGSGPIAHAISSRLRGLKVAVTSLGTGDDNDVHCDLCSESSIEVALSKLSEFDAVVINAKKDVVKPLQYRGYNELTETFQVGMVGPIFFLGLATQKKKLSAGSSIVSIGSQSQFSGLKYSVDYSSVKAALYGMNKSLIKEFVRKRIRVNSVIPDWIESGELPSDADRLGANDVCGFATAEQAAFPVVFLLSNKSRWISGQSLLFDGGRFLSRM